LNSTTESEVSEREWLKANMNLWHLFAYLMVAALCSATVGLILTQVFGAQVGYYGALGVIMVAVGATVAWMARNLLRLFKWRMQNAQHQRRNREDSQHP
jgi:uncharacterized membrane protein YcjF (UPF0283 family)